MFTINTATYQPEERSLIPAGTYRLGILKAEFSPLKSGNGHAIVLECAVLDGQHANRKVWSRLNVVHSNPTAQRIAQDHLHYLLKAIGIVAFGPDDVPTLVGRTFTAPVTIRAGTNGNKDQNEITLEKAAPDGGAGVAHAATPGEKPLPNWMKKAG